MSGNKNPYNILGVPKNASTEDIKKAFKRKAMEYHPDKTQGDKEKEDTFKYINEAYSILSDPEKKGLYDAGLYEFGSTGVPNPGAGFAGNDPFPDIFASFFGGGPGFKVEGMFYPGQRQAPKRHDIVTIKLDINDIYYGTTKKIEFELLDKCSKCSGTGANDPSQVIKCMNCQGSGMIHQRINPLMVAQSTCPSCQGKGEVRTGKACGTCKGEKAHFKKRAFELKLPKGYAEQHELHMEKKGAYDVGTGENNDIFFKFEYDIPENYKIDKESGDVEYQHNITIDDLLGGFELPITIFNERFVFVSDGYFNPNNKTVITGKGVYIPKNNKTGNLAVKFNVTFTNGEKLIKYKEVFQKIYNRPKNTSSDEGTIIQVSDSS